MVTAQFSNLRYLAVEFTFRPNVQDLIIRIVRVATRLEMLSLLYDNHTTLKSLDRIINFLNYQRAAVHQAYTYWQCTAASTARRII